MKKYLFALIAMIGLGSSVFAVAPSFDSNFSDYLTDKTPDQYGRVETVFSFSNCIDRKKTIAENIKNLFYPSTVAQKSDCSVATGGLLWNVIKVATFGLIFLFVALAGVSFVMNGASGDGAKKAASSMIYIAYGAFLVLGSIWILGYVLDITNLQGSGQLVDKVQNGLFLQILTFFKVLGFFLAIIMMVVAGFKMMSGMDKEDKIKEGKKSVLNIIVALVFIKIVDYVFYIAQMKDFASKASSLIIDVSRILGWVLGLAAVLGLFYAGYMLFFSGGDEKSFKKAKSILINIAIASLVIFLFLLIVYQIFNEFGG